MNRGLAPGGLLGGDGHPGCQPEKLSLGQQKTPSDRLVPRGFGIDLLVNERLRNLRGPGDEPGKVKPPIATHDAVHADDYRLRSKLFKRRIGKKRLAGLVQSDCTESRS